MTVHDDLATVRSGLDYLWGDEVKENAAYTALDRVEAELLSLREVAIARTASTESLRQRAEAAETEITRLERRLTEADERKQELWTRLLAAEAEAARLRDGLRRIADVHDSLNGIDDSEFARALLAEDGAA